MAASLGGVLDAGGDTDAGTPVTEVAGGVSGSLTDTCPPIGCRSSLAMSRSLSEP